MLLGYAAGNSLSHPGLTIPVTNPAPGAGETPSAHLPYEARGICVNRGERMRKNSSDSSKGSSSGVLPQRRFSPVKMVGVAAHWRGGWPMLYHLIY